MTSSTRRGPIYLHMLSLTRRQIKKISQALKSKKLHLDPYPQTLNFCTILQPDQGRRGGRKRGGARTCDGPRFPGIQAFGGPCPGDSNPKSQIHIHQGVYSVKFRIFRRRLGYIRGHWAGCRSYRSEACLGLSSRLSSSRLEEAPGSVLKGVPRGLLSD